MTGLAPLLTALREAGLPVGVAEMARLQRVFALSPPAGDDRLRGVLRAVLVKSAEESAVFERVFTSWLTQAELEVSSREAPQRPAMVPMSPARRLRPFRMLWQSAAAGLLLTLSLSLDGHLIDRPQESRPPAPSPATEETSPTSATPPPIEEAARPQTISVPELTYEPGPWPGWLPLGLGLLSLATGVTLWYASLRRRWVSESAPLPTRKGPPRVFLSPPKDSGLQLLQPREEEALVWGIGSFVAEELTRRLDLPATVRATARSAGIPHLVFHAARYPREVWLWVDEAADDPAIPRLAGEVAAALEAHGLPVEQALFSGIPDWLARADGSAFSPNEVDERRDAAMVAILTDGRVLARQYAADDRRVGLDALLRGLSHWPRLAFVDFSPPPGELGAILAPHGLDRITPEKLAGFLGADETLRRRTVVKADDVAIWAAACALAPAPVDEARAFALRKRLGLKASPWGLRALRAEAPGPPGRLQWTAVQRARRINWLRTAEAQDEAKGGLAPDSFLGRALAFWEEIYDRELADRTEGEAGALWKETPAHQHLQMERALLALWNADGVSEAISILHSLHGGALRDTVEEHLGRLAPLDWGGPDDLHLPWAWEQRAGPEQDMLLAMHFGGGMPPVELTHPGRLWLGLALCLGIGAGALGAAFGGFREPTGEPVLLHGPGKPGDAREVIRRTRDGWRVTVAAGRAAASREVPPDARVFVYWETQELPGTGSCRNGETMEDQGMVFVRICPGTFRMGSTDQELGAYDEKPAHAVTLSEYWIGQYEVTEEQYGKRRGSKLPATNVTWFDAQMFCGERGWYLPSGAEWEHAARAGMTTAWSFGDDEEDLSDYAWFRENSGFRPHPVGSKKPNRWGVHDMHGNVWEWVADQYGRSTLRGMRGGAFVNSPDSLRSGVWFWGGPSARNESIGFRCARGPRREALTP